MTGERQEPGDLSDILHEEMCTRHQPCGYGRATSHDAYYRDHARALHDRLEPEIGSANVALAVRVILEELW